MANHRRSKTRRKKSCGLCKPHKRAGNSESKKRATGHPQTRMAPLLDDWDGPEVPPAPNDEMAERTERLLGKWSGVLKRLADGGD